MSEPCKHDKVKRERHVNNGVEGFHNACVGCGAYLGVSDYWKDPITSTPAPEPMCPTCSKPTYAVHGDACPWSWRN